MVIGEGFVVSEGGVVSEGRGVVSEGVMVMPIREQEHYLPSHLTT